ncbi:MAG TPA: hypothetical protein VIY48_16310 [Candidatus Paceibacterota bacterium]
MMTQAKTWQFAKLAGLYFCGEEDGEPQWIGTHREFQEYRDYLAKDDRGEYKKGDYPWQPLPF